MAKAIEIKHKVPKQLFEIIFLKIYKFPQFSTLLREKVTFPGRKLHFKKTTAVFPLLRNKPNGSSAWNFT